MRIDPAPLLPPFVAALLPYRRGIARVETDALHFVDEGARADRAQTAVLLFHGNPTWSFLWRHVIAQLLAAEGCERVRVIAPDLLGLGLSDKPRSPSTHTVALHVSRMHALVEGLLEGTDARGRVIVVGQDWGGPIGAGVAKELEARRPGSVASMLFANTSVLVPARPFRPKAFHRFSQTPVISDLVFRGLGFPVFSPSRLGLAGVQGDRSSISGDVARAYRFPLRHLVDRAAPVGLARMVPDAEAHPSVPRLDEIGRFVEAFERPIGLVWGERDPILGRALERHVRTLGRALGGPAFVDRTSAGHFLQEEVPELLAARIAELARGTHDGHGARASA
ncbi:MAG: alpha/beta fold hydrolase [Sandaracinaceae bacterium]|nr:alpha/beta fold hydrolase [Sandaracinaceae bacterium]